MRRNLLIGCLWAHVACAAASLFLMFPAQAAECTTTFCDADTWSYRNPNINGGLCYYIAALEIARYRQCKTQGLNHAQKGLLALSKSLTQKQADEFIAKTNWDAQISNRIDSIFRQFESMSPGFAVDRIQSSIKRGMPSMILIRRAPWESGHAVVCFAYREDGDGIHFAIEDNNAPRERRELTYDSTGRWSYPYDRWSGFSVGACPDDDAVFDKVEKYYLSRLIIAAGAASPTPSPSPAPAPTPGAGAGATAGTAGGGGTGGQPGQTGPPPPPPGFPHHFEGVGVADWVDIRAEAWLDDSFKRGKLQCTINGKRLDLTIEPGVYGGIKPWGGGTTGPPLFEFQANGTTVRCYRIYVMGDVSVQYGMQIWVSDLFTWRGPGTDALDSRGAVLVNMNHSVTPPSATTTTTTTTTTTRSFAPNFPCPWQIEKWVYGDIFGLPRSMAWYQQGYTQRTSWTEVNNLGESCFISCLIQSDGRILDQGTVMFSVNGGPYRFIDGRTQDNFALQKPDYPGVIYHTVPVGSRIVLTYPDGTRAAFTAPSEVGVVKYWPAFQGRNNAE